MPKRKARGDSRKNLREPDVSYILKIPETGQSEEPDDLFDHPLHSTAVSSYEEEEVDKDPCSEPDGTTSHSCESEPAKKNTLESKNQPALKSRMELEDSEEEPVKENMLPRKRAKAFVKQMGSSPEMETDYLDSDDDPNLIKVWDPKGRKKVASHVTELDVILDEFEKITAKYKHGVQPKICRKAIDSFYTGFRNQLTNTATNAEELKKTKLKNTKMIRATNKKRQRLIEVKEELIRTEPQLKKLEKEYEELKGKISALENAVQLVTDLKELQQKYGSDRKEKSQKIEYGVSSLPALLVESRRILGAEGHFRNISAKIQQSLDLQKKS
ncbi:Centromere protein U [Varanus komodoensis]|nr:Centromere protein U [Varanus komodoensis]